MNYFNFILDKIPEIATLKTISQKTIISIKLNNLNELNNEFFNLIHSNELHKNDFLFFSIFINDVDFTSSVNNNKLIQLLFHPKFYKKNQSPIVFYTGILTNQENINSLSYNNGFNKIEFIKLGYINEVENFLHFSDENTFHEKYYYLISEKFYCGNFYTILNISTEKIPVLLNLKKDTEAKLKINNVKLWELMNAYIQASELNLELAFKLQLSNEDLKNQLTYLELFKSQDEANKINNFYYNEYEVLPLWYKRIGHILKVITGKRTIKSLFK